MKAAITERAPAVARQGPLRVASVARPHRPSKGAARSRVVSNALGEELKASVNGTSQSAASAAIDFDELADLIKMVHETDIVELELNSKRFKLSVKKREALEQPEPQYIHVQAPSAQLGYAPAPPAPAAPAPAAAAPAPAAPAPAAKPAAPAPAAAAADGFEVTSPMAGTFYTSPAPGEPAFCKEGDRVVKGQTIGIIEAMKLMNEIEAEASGTVVKLLAENGKPVTPGQALLILKP